MTTLDSRSYVVTAAEQQLTLSKGTWARQLPTTALSPHHWLTPLVIYNHM